MAQPVRDQVFISYSHKDQKWLDRLQNILMPLVRTGAIAVWADTKIKAGTEAKDEIAHALATAKVAVLLVSPNFLGSDSIAKHQLPPLLEAAEKDGVPILWVAVTPSLYEETEIGKYQAANDPSKPLDSLKGRALNAELVSIARKIVAYFKKPSTETQSSNEFETKRSSKGAEREKNLLPVSVLREFLFSRNVDQIIQSALKLAIFTDHQPPRLSTANLMFAISETGRATPESLGSPQRFHNLIRQYAGERYSDTFSLRFPKLASRSADWNIYSINSEGEVPYVRPNVYGVLRLAKEISRQTTPKVTRPQARAVIRSRHLLGALLSFDLSFDLTREQRRLSGAMSCLVEMGVDLVMLRERFLTYITESGSGDDIKIWKSFLLGDEPEGATSKSEEEEKGEKEEDFGRANLLPGFQADDWRGKDLLNIERDVNALAMLVAAWSVEPPLSIGLFGDWGSGKTFFMRKMMDRVEQLSRKARGSHLPQRDIGYYKNIVQIEFNAWHYIEGNLWASLVEHIFANLKFSRDEKESTVEKRKAKLLGDLKIEEEMKKRLEEEKEQLIGQQEKAKQRLRDTEEKRDDKKARLDLARRNFFSHLSLEHIVTPKKEELLKQAGILDDTIQSAEELRKSIQDVTKFSQGVRVWWNLIKNDPDRFKVLLWIVAAVLVAPAIGFLLLQIASLLGARRLPSFYAFLLQVVAVLAAAARWLRPYVKRAAEALQLVKSKSEAIDREISEAEKKQQNQVAQLKADVDSIDRQLVEGEQKVERRKDRIQNLTEAISKTTSSRILAEFIEDRAAASDYRRLLGVPAIIRRDFERLSDLFRKQREDEKNGKEQGDSNTINRMVLYIDDLDRCPPEQVVKLLQAIHLLLAFPLFVVVVGVDARWVIRALQESYDWLQPQPDKDGNKETSEEEKKNGPTFQGGATPHDYLEKIFQIPFWLRPFHETAFDGFIDGLIGSSRVNREEEVRKDNESSEVPDDKNRDRLDQQAKPRVDNLPSSAPTPPVVETKAKGAETGEPKQSGSTPVNQTRSIAEETTEGAIQGDAGLTGESETDEMRKHAEADQQEEEIRLQPDSLRFQDKEIEFIKQLTPIFGRSPRAIKRFVNCYRLIKAGLDKRRLDSFLEGDKDGDYRSAMILLGIITGAPNISVKILEELSRSPSDGLLEELVKRLNSDVELSEAKEWPRISEYLLGYARLDGGAKRLSSLIAMVPQVSRYSFRIANLTPRRNNKAKRVS